MYNVCVVLMQQNFDFSTRIFFSSSEEFSRFVFSSIISTFLLFDHE